jgi:hypothetical protein
MSNQTIEEYLEEERQKFVAAQLRAEADAARILPLQHGHHRLVAKPPKLELVSPVKATSGKKKRTKKTVAIKTAVAARTKTRVAKRAVAKTRKRA